MFLILRIQAVFANGCTLACPVRSATGSCKHILRTPRPRRSIHQRRRGPYLPPAPDMAVANLLEPAPVNRDGNGDGDRSEPPPSVEATGQSQQPSPDHFNPIPSPISSPAEHPRAMHIYREWQRTNLNHVYNVPMEATDGLSGFTSHSSGSSANSSETADAGLQSSTRATGYPYDLRARSPQLGASSTSSMTAPSHSLSIRPLSQHPHSE